MMLTKEFCPATRITVIVLLISNIFDAHITIDLKYKGYSVVMENSKYRRVLDQLLSLPQPDILFARRKDI